MAGQIPFFLTGANAKIIVNHVTMALAVNVSYRISVKHASPRVLGMYEVQEHQPLSYDVMGNFSIIRYLKNQRNHSEEVGAEAPYSVTNNGNGIGKWRQDNGNNSVAEAAGLDTIGFESDGKVRESFIPERMNKSMMFDMEIRQKAPDGGECTVARFRNCRIETAEFNLDKRSPATQSFTFKAQYVDEDTFIARKSGVGQDLT